MSAGRFSRASCVTWTICQSQIVVIRSHAKRADRKTLLIILMYELSISKADGTYSAACAVSRSLNSIRWLIVPICVMLLSHEYHCSQVSYLGPLSQIIHFAIRISLEKKTLSKVTFTSQK